MENVHAIPYLQEIVIILMTAGVIVPVFNRFHINPVLGYLIAGFFVGPYGLGSFHAKGDGILSYFSINNPEQVAGLANFGVVFLMFMIGLDLPAKRLWEMRRMVFGLGAMQVLASAVIIGPIAWAFGNSPAAATVLGATFALSSTAIVMQILLDSRRLSTPLGRACFSILLFQDLMVIPLLILLGMFGAGAAKGVGAAVFLALAKALAMVVVLFLAGRFILRPLFRLAGAAKGAEPFMAITLLTVIITAVMAGMAGLSMALGAFLGGLLLAETEYRHAIEAYIEPFKGLLLGLFFMTVGMSMDPRFAGENLFWLCASVAGLIMIKTAVIVLVARPFGLSWGAAVETGILLGQAGEFAFVIIGSAVTLKLLPVPVGQFMLITAGLSMIVTPAIASFARRGGAHIDKRNRHLPETSQHDIPEMHGHVIVAGLGRVGLDVTKILDAEHIPYLAIEKDTDMLTVRRKEGRPVSYGDASRHDLLRMFHPDRAQAIVLTMNDTHATTEAIRNIRRYWPNLPVYARARDNHAAQILHKAGASVVIAETMEASLQLSGSLLKGMGFGEDLVLRRLHIERDNAVLGIKGG